jgi:hypothetical protein
MLDAIFVFPDYIDLRVRGFESININRSRDDPRVTYAYQCTAATASTGIWHEIFGYYRTPGKVPPEYGFRAQDSRRLPASRTLPQALKEALSYAEQPSFGSWRRTKFPKPPGF